MDAATRTFVRHRAEDCCEYCGRHQDDSPLARLQIEHIIPRKHGGSDDPDNLCLACIDCNLGKSSNLTGIDPETGDTTKPIQLFNPRTQVWTEHFERRVDFIVGKTDVGRTTVYVLNMNDLAAQGSIANQHARVVQRPSPEMSTQAERSQGAYFNWTRHVGELLPRR